MPRSGSGSTTGTRGQPLDKVVQYNYANTVDYIDREILLTGKSVWEMPIEVDHSCGAAKNVPPGATPVDPYFSVDALKGIFY